jgi:hypothetical protein
MMFVRATCNAGFLSFGFQPIPPGMRVVSRIGPYANLITTDQIVCRRGVVDGYRCCCNRADKAKTFIHSNMRLISEHRPGLTLPLCKSGIRIVGRTILLWWTGYRFDQRRIEHRAALQDHTGSPKLPMEFGKKSLQQLSLD